MEQEGDLTSSGRHRRRFYLWRGKHPGIERHGGGWAFDGCLPMWTVDLKNWQCLMLLIYFKRKETEDMGLTAERETSGY